VRREYNKLVRDRIPEIIQREGRASETEVLETEPYRAALRAKLVEEAEEAAAADENQLVTEIADLYEVIDALLMEYGIDRDAVLVAQQERRRARGGFAGRLLLRWSDGP
jgi:predicted house-cleaning noncanonical NTP pyrophosphatase (MazG superfamily)